MCEARPLAWITVAGKFGGNGATNGVRDDRAGCTHSPAGGSQVVWFAEAHPIACEPSLVTVTGFQRGHERRCFRAV